MWIPPDRHSKDVTRRDWRNACSADNGRAFRPLRRSRPHDLVVLTPMGLWPLAGQAVSPKRLGFMAIANVVRGRRGVLVVVAVVIVGAAVALGLLIGSPAASTPKAAQLASVETACTQWLNANPNQPGTGQWCSAMAGWMDRSGMGPEMMWGDSDHMLSTCEQWMTTDPPDPSTALRGWCNSMVSWMTDHMGTWSGQDSWGGWMAHGSMMGG